MRTSLLLLLLLVLLTHVGNSFPSERRGSQGARERFASWDDVNIVAHGLLQLGQGLKEHVDKTKVQMRDIQTILKTLNSTVGQLAKRDKGAQDEALENSTGDRLMELADEVRAKVDEMKTESQSIHARMDRVEEKVNEALKEQELENSNNSDYSAVPLVQRLLEAQNRKIDGLVEKIKQQQDKLEKQSVHLQALQDKVAQKRVKSHRRRDDETVLEEITEQKSAPSGLAADCHQLFLQGLTESGVYTIQPLNSRPFEVFCEITSEGGWTIIQRREDGSQNFNQQWEEYKRGFGSLSGEFWLGLENIHSLSKQGRYTLQVELSYWKGQQEIVQSQFSLDGEDNNYALHLNHGSSGALESTITTGASGLPFSTADRDNDLNADVNCAELLSGGWWFSSCGSSNLNGKYTRRSSGTEKKEPRTQRMFWKTPRRHSPLKSVVLKVAPIAIKQ